MLLQFLPLILVVCSNVCYHIFSKSTPANANPFASLFVTYSIAACITFILLLFTTQGKNLFHTFQQLNWSSFLLGFAIVGLEFGYLQAYRIGWDISVCSLLANITLGVILFLIGVLCYREQITKQQLFGVIFCLVGIFFLNRK
ncbi:MAG TPA: EamA family transporter [Candidatus Coprocola pullicola]|nr:EamA family transporter [Candidatus Coprocola pullicola]